MPIAIVGIACTFPKAGNLEEFWSNIREGVDAITGIPSTHWKPEDYFDEDPAAPDMTYARTGGFIDPVDFDPIEFGIAPNNIEATDTTQLFSLIAARDALRSAGYATTGKNDDGRPFDRSRCSVILGVTGTLELVIPLGARLGHPLWRKALKESGVDDATAGEVIDRIAGQYVPWQENSFPGLLGNVAAGRVANRLDLGGTNCVVDAACGSSLSAVHMAAMELRTNRADMVITGGVDTFNDIFMYMCFSKTSALSPSGNAMPFDKKADGTILGEGIGLLVMKRLDDARRDNDRIIAILRGTGASSDGAGNAVYAPSAEGQTRALRNAYADAGVSPGEIDLVEAHGTGTVVGDRIELSALCDLYGQGTEKKSWCAVGSIKSMIGHTKAAAGIAGLIKVAMALKNKTLPPTIKVDDPADIVRPGEAPLYVNTEKRPWPSSGDGPRLGAVSAFGFGGSNFHCVIEEAERTRSTPDWDGDVTILPFSGADRGEIEKGLDETAAWNREELRFHSARLRSEFQGNAKCRLAVVIDRSGNDAATSLGKAKKFLLEKSEESWQSPDGSFFSAAGERGSLGLVFPGQGSQYCGMLRDLSCRFPELLDALEGGNTVFGENRSGPRLSDYIYPVPVFSDEERKAGEARLRDTAVAQPAIGAVSLGLWKLLQNFGIEPEAFGGHSFGELTALCAAGVFDENTLHRLGVERGRLMAEGSGDRGSMLAVSSDRKKIEALLKEERFELIVANHNSPRQSILSGSTAEIDRAAAFFKSKKMRCQKLAVSAAFHSPFVADAGGPFAAALGKEDFNSPRTPVYSNTIGAVYPGDGVEIREILSRHLTSGVEFVAEIESMYADGVRFFLECGPGKVLTGLIGAILKGREHRVSAVDSSKGKNPGLFDLACALAGLAVSGQAVNLAAWDPDPPPPAGKKPKISVPISGANYVMPRKPLPPRSSPAPAVSRTETPGKSAEEILPPAELHQSLQTVQQSILALQKIQEQTAGLHRQYLEGQSAAQQTIHGLLQQQRAMLGLPEEEIVPPKVQASAPAPVMSVPPQHEHPSQPAAPVPHESSPPSASAGIDAMTTALLEAVAEKTGYPTDMLELGMNLDSDLGIDSIKRVEILSAFQEKMPEAPAVSPDEMGSIHTLGDIVDFLARAGGTLSESPAVSHAAPEAEASAVPGATVSTASGLEAMTSALLEAVAEKTGYPTDMLELGMNLDSDLGIDSIKRVEILSAFQEKMPEAPAVSPDEMGSIHTLGDIVDFLARPGKSPDPPAPDPPAGTPSPAAVVVSPRSDGFSVNGGVKRSLPTVTSISGERRKLLFPAGSELLVTDDGGDLAPRVSALLKERGVKARIIDPADSLKAATASHAGGLLIISPKAPADDFIGSAFDLVRGAGPSLRAAADGDPLLVTVSRLDGAFGFTGEIVSPLSGGLAGLVKTAAIEWPKVRCKSIDVDDSEPGKLAGKIVDELFLEGPVEVGITSEAATTVSLQNEDLNGVVAKNRIGEGDLVVVSGGARGVTAEVLVSLAKHWRPAFLILGRTPMPDREETAFAGIEGEGNLKKAIISAAEKKLTPKEVEKEYASLVASREILANLDRIERAGAKVIYRSADTRDFKAVADAVAAVSSELGPVKGIVHGAGVLADRLILDKSRVDFDRVFSTKVDSLKALLGACESDALRVALFFSSSTARFGRRGQADYAAANEVLNKSAQQLSRRLPRCRVVSVNWGPWDGGMVTPRLREIFAGEGVGVIPLRAGAEYAALELAQDTIAPVETVVLGITPSPVGTGRVPATAIEDSHPVFERTISLDACPVLRSHVLGGRAVVPLALISEWLAHAAMHDNIGLHFAGFNDLQTFRALTVGRDEQIVIQVCAEKPEWNGGEAAVSCEIRLDGNRHARAEVLLSESAPKAGTRAAAPLPAGSCGNGLFYEDGRLFHGPALQGIVKIDVCGPKGLKARCKTAPPPSAWIREPLRSSWLADPLLLDCVFQLMILWSQEEHRCGSLPTKVGSYRQFVQRFPAEGCDVTVTLVKSGTGSATADIEIADDAGNLVAVMKNCDSVFDPLLNDTFRQNSI